MIDFNQYRGEGGFWRLIKDIAIGYIIYLVLMLSYPCIQKQQLKDRRERIERENKTYSQEEIYPE